MTWLYVAAGGAAGAVARYGLSGWVHDHIGFRFPWGTFIVNVAGSVLIGFAMRYLEATSISADVRALITIGLLGAFTTFSTFSYETVGLLEKGAYARAAVFSFGSLLLGVVAVYGGMIAASPFVYAGRGA
jgi:CrcB protein